jgi:uncharacterized protein YjbI with pentapeptide repeats
MVSKDRSWWQKNRKPLIIVAVIATLAIVLALIFFGYRFSETGFQKKTLWDWMSLLTIPVILALVGFFFTRTELRNEQAIAKQRAETEQDLAIDNQQEAALQGYLDRMSALLLEKNLRESKPDDEVRTVARVRTLTMLYQLNTRRTNYMLSFLRESKLITDDPSTSIITFSEADLSNANLQGVDFYSIDFSKANLREANLREADLIGANLSEAYLRKANLSGANLSDANLSGANLSGANLSGANLSEANLSGTNLSEANLSGADLSGADLNGANLGGANLGGADLNGAKLQEATYNTKAVQEKDVDGRPVTLEPTQWPQGFDPKSAGAIYDDC